MKRGALPPTAVEVSFSCPNIALFANKERPWICSSGYVFRSRKGCRGVILVFQPYLQTKSGHGSFLPVKFSVAQSLSTCHSHVPTLFCLKTRGIHRSFTRSRFPFAQSQVFGQGELVELLRFRGAFETLKIDGAPLQDCW